MNKDEGLVAAMGGDIIEIVDTPWEIKYEDERFYERYDGGPWIKCNLNYFSVGLTYQRRAIGLDEHCKQEFKKR